MYRRMEGWTLQRNRVSMVTRAHEENRRGYSQVKRAAVDLDDGARTTARLLQGQHFILIHYEDPIPLVHAPLSASSIPQPLRLPSIATGKSTKQKAKAYGAVGDGGGRLLLAEALDALRGRHFCCIEGIGEWFRDVDSVGGRVSIRGGENRD